MTRRDYLLDEHSRLECNLLQAITEETQIAIYKRIMKINEEIFKSYHL